VTPLIVAVLFAAVCVVMFGVGLRYYRMADPPEGATAEQVRRFGRLMMMGATAMLLFLVAVIVRGDFSLKAGG
jgi:hypothetical protein